MDSTSKSSQDDPDTGFDVKPSPGETFPSFEDAAPESSAASTTSSSAAPLSEAAAAALFEAKKEKGRVRFNSKAAETKPEHLANVPSTIPEQGDAPPPVAKPRPSVLRGNSSNSVTTVRDLGSNTDIESARSMSAAAAAKQRAEQVAAKLQRDSPTPSSRNSLESTAETATSDNALVQGEFGIPLHDLNNYPKTRDGGWTQVSTEDGQSQAGTDQAGTDDGKTSQDLQDEAYKLVRAHTQRFGPSTTENQSTTPAPAEQAPTDAAIEEMNVGGYDGVYTVPPPQEYRGSVLSQLLKLYNKPNDTGSSHKRNSSYGGGTLTPGTRTPSGSTTPTTRRKWYEQNRSQDTLANLIGASAKLANPGGGGDPEAKGSSDGKGGDSKGDGKNNKKRPIHKRTASASRLSQFWQSQEARITVHIAETLSRQAYIIKLCRALMLYGAPTHRLEEYMTMTARVLEIDGQFLYLPGCMIISFDDKSTHTTEVRIVRTAQGIDLGKLKDVHHIYKEVMHDVYGVEEGTRRLDELMSAKDKFNPWLRVLVFGLTSATAGPFSFSARLIDLPLSFCFGCLVGLLQLIVASRSQLYSNVFEVTATVIVSFLARAFGSIRGGDLFCFSAMAQGGIVMLLPGYSVLCSALELQSRAIVPGSIRIVYAIIYSLLLGYGITVGAALYGLFDSNATSATTCQDPMPSLITFAFVPPFVACISILYQAKWRQMPIMIFIAFAGYVVNFFSSQKFAASPSIANTLGALAVGVLANLYSRVRHGVAAATLIPAIFAQVPGGLASTGGLLSGLTTANMLTNSSHEVNGTSTVHYQQGEQLNTVIFDVAASMIQIAIGIAVGLFMSALIIYPFGKRRSGLFSF